VVNIIEEKTEQSIGHALKIYQVKLTLRSKTMTDDGLQSSECAITQLTLYADRAQVREYLQKMRPIVNGEGTLCINDYSLRGRTKRRRARTSPPPPEIPPERAAAFVIRFHAEARLHAPGLRPQGSELLVQQRPCEIERQRRQAFDDVVVPFRRRRGGRCRL
jgi:hypothetical protein